MAQPGSGEVLFEVRHPDFETGRCAAQIHQEPVVAITPAPAAPPAPSAPAAPAPPAPPAPPELPKSAAAQPLGSAPSTAPAQASQDGTALDLAASKQARPDSLFAAIDSAILQAQNKKANAQGA